MTRILKPVVMFNRVGGQVDDPTMRDFRPATMPADAQEDLPTISSTELKFQSPAVPNEGGSEEDPKGSSATGSASDSGGESNENSTDKEETSKPPSPSGSPDAPVSAEKANLQPSLLLKTGSATPPVAE